MIINFQNTASHSEQQQPHSIDPNWGGHAFTGGQNSSPATT